jgi:hypothetical protein
MPWLLPACYGLHPKKSSLRMRRRGSLEALTSGLTTRAEKRATRGEIARELNRDKPAPLSVSTLLPISRAPVPQTGVMVEFVSSKPQTSRNWVGRRRSARMNISSF